MDSVLFLLTYLTNNRFAHFGISNDEVNNIIKVLKLNKAHGPDEISVNLRCYAGINLFPLRIIFQNIIDTVIFPNQWKRKTPTSFAIKQTVLNYRSIFLFPLFAKIFEGLVFKDLYLEIEQPNN